MNEHAKGKEKGLRILTFDGDGAGCISQLYMLEEYMNRLAHDLGADVDSLCLADLVGVMGGTGFGGWAALLLGRLRLPVRKAIKELISVGQKVFPSKEKLEKGKTSLEERTRRLRAAVEDTHKRLQVPVDATLRDETDAEPTCKVVVLAVPDVHLNHCRLFRTYSSRRSNSKCTLLEAACATMASPSLFAPVPIGPEGREEMFVGASIGFNNPTNEILKEVKRHFGDGHRISLILSIGSGRAEVASLDSKDSGHDHGPNLSRLLMDSEKVAQDLSREVGHAGLYFRLKVDRGMENVKPEDWDRAGAIKSHTDAYLDTPTIINGVDVSLGVMFATSRKGGAEPANNEYNYHIWRADGYARLLPLFSFPKRLNGWE